MAPGGRGEGCQVWGRGSALLAARGWSPGDWCVRLHFVSWVLFPAAARALSLRVYFVVNFEGIWGLIKSAVFVYVLFLAPA